MTRLAVGPMVWSIGVYTEMLSAPLAIVTAATDQAPVATTGESSSRDEDEERDRERIAEIRPRAPRAMGTRPSRPTHRSGTIVRPSAAAADTATSTAMPVYWPIQMCHGLGLPLARAERKSTVRTIRSSTLVPAKTAVAAPTVPSNSATRRNSRRRAREPAPRVVPAPRGRAPVAAPMYARRATAEERRPSRCQAGAFHFWLAAPVQVQICSRVPSAELLPVTSRHLLAYALTRSRPAVYVHCCDVPP